jgi:hypothetical protein
MTQPAPGVRNRLVVPALIRFRENDAGAAGVDQSPDTVAKARIQHILSADDICSVKRLSRSPHAGQARGVKNRVNSSNGFIDCRLIAHVTLHDFKIGTRIDLASAANWQASRCRISAQRANAVSAIEQLPSDVPAQTTASAGDECQHGSPQFLCGPDRQLLAIDFDIVPHIHGQRLADQNFLDFFRVVCRLAELAQLGHTLMPSFFSARHSAGPVLNYNCRAAIPRSSDSD